MRTQRTYDRGEVARQAIESYREYVSVGLPPMRAIDEAVREAGSPTRCLRFRALRRVTRKG